MDFIYLGKLTNTHGIKGEVRILSDFEKKTKVFQKDFNLYLGTNKDKYIINTYRVHKNYDMVTFKDINNINDIEKYKGMKVYINKDDLKLKTGDFLYQDLIGIDVYDEENVLIGKIIDYMYNKANILLQVDGTKQFYIPYVAEYIDKVDINNKKIKVKNVKGLII